MDSADYSSPCCNNALYSSHHNLGRSTVQATGRLVKKQNAWIGDLQTPAVARFLWRESNCVDV